MAMAAKKTTKGAPNKSDFVRSLPKDMSAKEVVSKAKAAGIALTEMYVYSIRSKAKATKKGAAPKAAAKTSTSSAKKAVSPDSLTAMIEAIVERKVDEVLQSRLKSLFGK